MKKIKDKFGITVVIPTKGRETLKTCLESLKPTNQGGYGADVIVVIDTYALDKETIYNIRDLCDKFYVSYVEYNAGYSDWGYPQLNYVYKYGNCSDFIMNIGDDDVMIEGAFYDIMHVIETNGIMPYMFQSILYPSAHRGNKSPVLLWNDENRTIVRKAVTGQNLIVPNIPHLMGQMTDDFEFIRQTIERWHGLVKWIPIPIVKCY